MVVLRIRDVPEEMRNRLAAIAAERGQSLQAYLYDVLADEVRRRDDLAVLEAFSAGRHGTRVDTADVLDALHAARAERDRALGVPPEDAE
ncbi:hypothetical protein [Streptomyces sp. CC208A]|uniref:FitA-like ribbon-helix-helix domain-containing protein n=1 Tax=Streptomyces sp. CC208A TaxID=3044573 RepID=UPI0024A85EA6|nr:hypothetical protein [Streptomyces sp. CC208A]